MVLQFLEQFISLNILWFVLQHMSGSLKVRGFWLSSLDGYPENHSIIATGISDFKTLEVPPNMLKVNLMAPFDNQICLLQCYELFHATVVHGMISVILAVFNLKEMKEIFIKAANCNSRNVVVCSMAHC